MQERSGQSNKVNLQHEQTGSRLSWHKAWDASRHSCPIIAHPKVPGTPKLFEGVIPRISNVTGRLQRGCFRALSLNWSKLNETLIILGHFMLMWLALSGSECYFTHDTISWCMSWLPCVIYLSKYCRDIGLRCFRGNQCWEQWTLLEF